MPLFHRVLVLLACSIAALRASAGPAPARLATVDVDGRALRVPAPAGMSRAPQLDSAYADATRDLGGDLKGVFWPDSALARLRPGGRPPDPRSSAALVLVYRGVRAQTPGQLRARMVYGGNTDQALRARSSDTVLFDRIRRTLHDDPEGRAEVALPSAPGENVGVASFRVGEEAVGWIQASAFGLGGPARAPAPPRLRATATVIAGDRVIGMVMVRDERPTTRSVATLRRAFREWVRATIEANDSLPGSPDRDSIGR